MQNKPNLIVMVGLSGSGKSTKAERLSKKLNAKIISSDNIREELTGDINNQTENERVFKEVYKRIRNELERGSNVIFDSTAINMKSRRKLFYEIQGIDCKVIAHIIPTPYSICQNRNKSRERVVPEEVIRRQRLNFEIPFKEEGFEDIIIDGWQDHDWTVDDANMIELPFNLMEDFDQKNSHHQFSLSHHCALAGIFANNTLKFFGETNKALENAAYIHDIGKLETQSIGEDGQAHYYNHSNVGTYSLLSNLDCLSCNTYEEVLKVLFYVNYHMHPFFLNTDKSKEKWESIFGKQNMRDLMLLNMCDKRASGKTKTEE